jgi:uncharacterized membrane protein YeaQ/YmgE (transglycosylase-associated protein family)
MIVNFILWCLFGLIAGAIAQFLMPGNDPGHARNPMGYVITIVLGVLGAALGGYLSSLLLGWDVAAGFNLPSMAVAVGGALLLLLLYRVVSAAGIGPTHTAHRH